MTKSSPPKCLQEGAHCDFQTYPKNKTAPKVVAEKVRGAYRATARKVSAERSAIHGTPPLFSSNFPARKCRTHSASLPNRNVAHTRELYEGSKNTLQAVLESWQKSFGAAGQGAAVLNRRFIDLAERNINTGFDLATGLAGARNLAEVMELQATYWRKLFGELRAIREDAHCHPKPAVRAEIGNSLVRSCGAWLRGTLRLCSRIAF